MNDYAVKLLVHELSKFRCDIVGIAETHLFEVEEMEEGESKILASGREEGVLRSGVALVLSQVAQRALVGYTPISDCIIMATFRTFTGELIVIQVYAPTADAEDKFVTDFYDTLQSTLNTIPDKTCVVLMGDLNAQIRDAKSAAPGITGKHHYGKTNTRGEQLLDFCGLNGLLVATTLFRQSKESRCWTWESPDGEYYNRIDYIMVSGRWRSIIQNARGV